MSRPHLEPGASTNNLVPEIICYVAPSFDAYITTLERGVGRRGDSRVHLRDEHHSEAGGEISGQPSAAAPLAKRRWVFRRRVTLANRVGRSNVALEKVPPCAA